LEGNLDPAHEKFFVWRIATHGEFSGAFPEKIVSLAAPISPSDVAPEVSIMLPNRDAHSLLRLPPPAGRDDLKNAAMGVFLSDPFLRLESIAARLVEWGIDTVINFPTVEQQDVEFTGLLADVGLDKSLEFKNLEALSKSGLRLGIVTNSREGGAQAAKLNPTFLFVVPKVPDFAAGFPSLRQRGALVQVVRQGALESGWDGPILMLGQQTEADHPRLWPDGVSGVASFTGETG